MTIVDKIIKSIKAVHGDDFPVYYHDDPTLNLMTSQMEFPCALVMLLTRGSVPNIGGQLKEQVSAAVFFVELQDGIDFDAVKNERIVDRCKRRALAWVLSLTSSYDLEMVNEAQSTRVYDRYDDILTGYGVQADIRETIGFTGCEPCPSDFNGDFSEDFGGSCDIEEDDFNNDFNNDFKK